jgi:hypothetical protein
LTYLAHQDFDGKLNFATDAWSSLNYKAYIAFTVHFENHGKLMSMLLDIIKVAQSHTGVILGDTFVEVLKAFGIERKVRQQYSNQIMVTHLYDRSSASQLTTHQIMTQCFSILARSLLISPAQPIRPDVLHTQSICVPSQFSSTSTYPKTMTRTPLIAQPMRSLTLLITLIMM